MQKVFLSVILSALTMGQMLIARPHHVVIEEEFDVFKSLVKDASVLFDVGANIGDWTETMSEHCPNAQIYAFEPTPQIFEYLSKRYANNKNIFCFEAAVNNNDSGVQAFHAWNINRNVDFGGNSLHSRPLEYIYNSKPDIIKVNTISLDKFCKRNNITHIDFLKVDVEGSERDVLVGATELIKNNSIDYIQFEYCSAFINSGCTLKEVYFFLKENGYRMYRLRPDKAPIEEPEWKNELETYGYEIYLATLFSIGS